ncbi:hypothetical protein [Flavobacterium aestivum]|uniref:hypothetical protein n=1 Tax=Flavobacterium aestivum TaxID=3003257 RepID=UPI002482B9F2|nr:hypothetical protein [Flavobacterium aestivum]
MRKILLLLSFFLSFAIKAQDLTTINKLEKSYTIDEMRALSDKISKSANTKLNFLNIENEKSPTEKLIVFQYTADGKNNDLTIMFAANEAEGAYYFKNAFGKYSDLAGFYVSTFYPTSSQDIVFNNFKLQEYRVNKDLRYKISELEPDNWTIEKTY